MKLEKGNTITETRKRIKEKNETRKRKHEKGNMKKEKGRNKKRYNITLTCYHKTKNWLFVI
jgi:hypothetical protein